MSDGQTEDTGEGLGRLDRPRQGARHEHSRLAQFPTAGDPGGQGGGLAVAEVAQSTTSAFAARETLDGGKRLAVADKD
ncbi:MAG: hypothetical protein NVSMB16_05260 [Acidimicrobiales bacterium]